MQRCNCQRFPFLRANPFTDEAKFVIGVVATGLSRIVHVGLAVFVSECAMVRREVAP